MESVRTLYRDGATSLALSFTHADALALASPSSEARAAADRVWASDSNKELDTHLLDSYNTALHKSIDGAGGSRELELKNSLSKFAAAKSHSLTQSLAEAKAQAGGKKKAYREASAPSVAAHTAHLAAERQAASHRARAAKQWEGFQRERKLYPNIEWTRSRSANPRDQHLAYVGNVWPMDDPFWNTNQPGCVYGCKCGWRTTDRVPTDNKDVKVTPPSPGLEGNPYVTGEIFTDKHPYFRDAPKHIPSLGPLHNADNVAYIPQVTASGKQYLVHYNTIGTDEYIGNTNIAEILVNNGFNNIKLLPQIHSSEIALRERYFGKEYNKRHPASNPDAIVDNDIVEFKISSRNNFMLRVREAAYKSNIAIIHVRETLTDNYIARLVNGVWSSNDAANLNEIVIINNGKALRYARKSQRG